MISPADGGFLDVPMIGEVVVRVDLEGRIIVLDIPDGLPTRKRR